MDSKRFNSDECSIIEYVERCIKSNEKKLNTRYRKPVIGFSEANDPLYRRLREVVVSTHLEPRELLKESKSVISIFLPFSEKIIESNYAGINTSKDWATAYSETNNLLDNLCFSLADQLKAKGYEAMGIKTTHHLSHARKDSYEYEEMFSNWSQRHVAFISGIGNFGLNNLLITVRGCAGRIGSVLTSAKIKPTERPEQHFCLVKRGEDCHQCVKNCPVKALNMDGEFDRNKCMSYLVKQRKHQEEAYGFNEGTQSCGKCSVNIPCQARIPD